MSMKIPRRSFLKGVGSVAAAAAATGLLAGCSTDPANPSNPTKPNEPDLGGSDPSDNPGTSGGTDTKVVHVGFMLTGSSTEQVGNAYEIVVSKDATTIDVADIDPSWIPEGCSLASTGSLEIESVFGQWWYVTVLVTRDEEPEEPEEPATVDIRVKFVDNDTQVLLSKTATVTVVENAEFVDVSAVPAPEGYAGIGSVAQIGNGEAVVYVAKAWQTITVEYMALGLIKWFTIATEIIHVPAKITEVPVELLRKEVVDKNDSRKSVYVFTDSRTMIPIRNGRIEVAVRAK